MRLSFSISKKDDGQKEMWANLANKLNLNDQMLKMASSGEKPSMEIVKEGMVINYHQPTGEYTIRLGNKADIVVKGIARQEKDLNSQVRTALAYIKEKSPVLAKELEKIEANTRNVMVYKDIDRCRDCVFMESDTSHETYRDKCKNCLHATLGGNFDHFMPRSQQIVVYTPGWHQGGDALPKQAFQDSLSLLDAHRKGQKDDKNPEVMAKAIVGSASACKAHSVRCACLASHMFKYFKDNKVNFQRYGKAVVDHIERQTGIQIHIADGLNTRFPKVAGVEGWEMEKPFKGVLKSPVTPVENMTTFRGFTQDGQSIQVSQIVSVKQNSDQSYDIETENSKYKVVPMPAQGQAQAPAQAPVMARRADASDAASAAGKAAENIQKLSPEEKAKLVHPTPGSENVSAKEWGEPVNRMKPNVSASKKEPKEMPGALKPAQRKALDDYEKVKDNMPKSRELAPKGGFSGTLCLAEVK